MNNKQNEILELIDNEVITKKVNNPKGKGLPTVPETEKGDNTKYLKHTLSMWDLPMIDIRDENKVEERIKWYFNKCVEDDMKPTITELAMALGVNRKTLYRWANEQARELTHSPIVKKAYQIIENLWEQYMLNGKINPVSGIFLGKNHFGYTDKQEIIVEPKNPLGTESDPEKIQEKYLEEQDIISITEETESN